MKIVRNEATKEIAGIGAVAFEAFESTRGTYWHEQYGRTHSQAFRFTAEGREYWGTVTRTFDRNGKPGERTFFDVELRTRFSGSTHSRALPETAKAAWRRALIRHFKAELEAFNAARDAETGAPSLSLDNMSREEPATVEPMDAIDSIIQAESEMESSIAESLLAHDRARVVRPDRVAPPVAAGSFVSFPTATARDAAGNSVTVMRFGEDIVCYDYSPESIGAWGNRVQFALLAERARNEYLQRNAS